MRGPAAAATQSKARPIFEKARLPMGTKTAIRGTETSVRHRFLGSSSDESAAWLIGMAKFVKGSKRDHSEQERVLCVTDAAVSAAGRGDAGAQDNQENFLPLGALPIIGDGVNGETGGAPFFLLFLSAFGFFFSRLLLNWPFALVVLALLGG